MIKLSRRALAAYAVEQLQAGKSVSGIAKRLAAGLKESGKANEVEFLINDVIWQLEQSQQLAIGKVTSAHSLSDQLKQALKLELKKITGAKEVSLREKVDKSVLGGLRVETAEHVWDDTVSRKLAELKEAV
jgi:F-type H+-transporting ATPase subunit delta